MTLQYNKDLFDAAGVEYPTAKWTWDDLRAAAEKLTGKNAEGKSVLGLVTPVNCPAGFPSYIRPVAASSTPTAN